MVTESYIIEYRGQSRDCIFIAKTVDSNSALQGRMFEGHDLYLFIDLFIVDLNMFE